MAAEVTALMVGIGSIGRRHLGNLRLVAAERGLKLDVCAWRHARTELDAETSAMVDRQYYGVDQLPHCDLAFVCNPSQNHLETLRALQGKAGRVFVEKPVFTRALTEDEVGDFADERRFYVACPLRYTETYAALRDYVARHRIYSVRSICSSYLPAWRQGVDYRQLYSARRESGGVRLDLIHEFDYLFSLFGFPDRASLFAGKVSHLEIESTDLVAYIGDYRDKMVELHLDYFGRTPVRCCEVFSEEATVKFDFLAGKEDRNASYLREMRYFFDFALNGAENVNSIPFANRVVSAVMQ